MNTFTLYGKHGLNQFSFITSDYFTFLQDKDLVCFRDIFPAAPHHYLVIPREHIISCKSLNRRNIDLVKRMAKLGKEVLCDQGITDMKDVRLGFHQPPFISVDHLHLHVLAPASKISDYMEYKFTPGTDRFIIEESLRKRLEKVPPKAFDHFLKLWDCS